MQTMNAKTQSSIVPGLAAADMETILALVRCNTLAEAGSRIGVDGSTVFRTLQRIEKKLGQRLFERSRVGYRPNELAQQLAVHAERIEVELEAARNTVGTSDGVVSGSVKISTTDTVLHMLLFDALKPLAKAHPLLQFELNTSNELSNLTRRDTDIALRATRKPPEHLIGRHMGPIRFALFSSKTNRKQSVDLAELARATWVAPDDALPEHPSVIWRKRYCPKVMPQYKVNSVLSVAEAVAAGLGIGMFPILLAKGRSDLVQISDTIDEAETQLWMLTHPELRHLRRIATVAAHLAETIRLE